MFKIVCVTARALCPGDFLAQLERVAAAGVDKIILREKDLPEPEYKLLAAQALALCRRYGVECAVHNFPQTANELGAPALHLPLPRLRALSPEERAAFPVLGASCHSLEDVREAAELGCSYGTLGHIFPTGCKPGLPPRGVELLAQVCQASPLPVYAIGGVGPGNIAQVKQAGAAGACVMSGFMTAPDPARLVGQLRKEAEL
ncbi:thiamine-phosphate pyrophosphorylase [Firmicutes bacterium CAG:94]|nr:thiamine-phosphate pyrophosphorylase [Firmicutes bacterium CAG:94]